MPDPAAHLALLALCLAPLRGPAPFQGAGAREASARPAADEVAARGRDTVIDFDELDRVLLGRHGLAEEGRGVIKHLVQSLLLERLAAEANVTVTRDQVQLRWEELDRQLEASGETGGLEGYLKKTRMSEAELRRFLRLSFVHEILTRRALAIPEDRQVSGEQQTLWIEQVMSQRGYEVLPRPWTEGVVARCGDIAATLDGFREHLRKQLPPEDVEDACFDALLEKRVLLRMPDLAEEALRRAIDGEVARRRFEAESDPRYQGVTYEALLGARGMTVDEVRQDPAVRAAALARLWVDRSYTDEDLRKVYESEREYFDGRFGEAVQTLMLFRRAAALVSEVNPRSFDQAESELEALRGRIRTEAEFVALAEKLSEDAQSRDGKGLLGWVTRGDPRITAEVRDVVFAALDEGRYPRDGAPRREDRLIGPLRMSTGCALLWLGSRRPAPVWEVMKENVHRELRGRFLQEVLPRSELVSYLDVD